MRSRPLNPLAVLTVALLVCACQHRTAQPPPSITAGFPPEFPTTFYSGVPADALYRVDAARSALTIKVYRAGALAKLGHNHVITSKRTRWFRLSRRRLDEGARRSIRSGGQLRGGRCRRARRRGPRVLDATDARRHRQHPRQHARSEAARCVALAVRGGARRTAAGRHTVHARCSDDSTCAITSRRFPSMSHGNGWGTS